MLDGTISKIEVVFDPNNGKHCWTYKSLARNIVGEYFCTIFNTPETKVICTPNQMRYEHPVFGLVDRSGWLLIKRWGRIVCSNKEINQLL